MNRDTCISSMCSPRFSPHGDMGAFSCGDGILVWFETLHFGGNMKLFQTVIQALASMLIVLLLLWALLAVGTQVAGLISPAHIA